LEWAEKWLRIVTMKMATIAKAGAANKMYIGKPPG
jgi:hypothetical protein